MRRKVPRKVILAAGAALVAIVLLCFFNRHMLEGTPFTDYGLFNGPSGVFGGPSGRTYIIDNGKKSVLILNQNGDLKRTIVGGDMESGFYYASLVAEGDDGSIYVSDTLYSGEGTTLSAERVFRYAENGDLHSLVYEIPYENHNAAPLQYGLIHYMAVDADELVMVVLEQEALDVRVLDIKSGELKSTRYALPGYYISHGALNPKTRLPVFVTRLGEVCAVKPDGRVDVLVDKDAGRTAWRLCCDGEAVYYTDLATNMLLRVDLSTGEETAAIMGDDILYTAIKAGQRLYSTDSIGYYVADGDAVQYVESVLYESAALRTVLWVLVIIGALLLLFLLYTILANVFFHKKRTVTFQRVIIVTVVSACIAVMVSYVTLDYMVINQNKTIMGQLGLFGDVLVKNTNVEALKQVNKLEDYKGEHYNAVKEPLDSLMDMSYENELYYYYAIYVTDGEMIYGVMDYEDTITTRHPLYPWGTEGYTDVLANGDHVDVSADVSIFGSWSFVLKPVLDADGSVVAIMEVGVNLDDLTKQNQDLVVQIALIVASMAIVLLMLILEAIFFLEYRERKRALAIPDVTARFPLRTIIFLVFLADCMQDAFVSILANQLYTPFWGIPQSVGGALPLSVQVLVSAISAFACGTLVRRLGIKKTLAAGLFIQMAGFVICAVFMDYFSLLLGKAIIGMGMGLVIVCLNSIAALGDTQENMARAFTAISAGTLAGVTVGSGMGSLALSFGNYSTVYYVAAAVLVIAFMMALSGADYKQRESIKTERMGMLRFLTDRKVITFLLMLLTPFLIGLSFREYFFPIYAAEMGMSEVDIGRIYLLCGLAVIYLGPVLTKGLIGRFGAKWTVVLASALMAVATLLFAAVPTLPAAILGTALLAVAISFGYAAQTTYYADLPRVAEYGESQAMGVYSLFDNGGQTLGPTVYGIALLAGYQHGLLVIGLALVCLTGLFVLSNAGHKKNKEKVKSSE